MTLKINGKEEILEKEMTLTGLIKDKGLNGRNIVIECNLEIVPRQTWGKVDVKDGDSIEIISFTGGG
ncbi:MAG: sulfur carrier protein ThiS [Candidatus Tantalella remota]|nr:sulfur carrier protein ThiS [Candidatus Tantalella remota]